MRCCNPYLLQCKGGLHLLTTLSHWLLSSADFVHQVVQTFSSHRWGSEKPGLRRENLCMRVRCTLCRLVALLTTAGPPRRSFRLHRTIRSQQPFAATTSRYGGNWEVHVGGTSDSPAVVVQYVYLA